MIKTNAIWFAQLDYEALNVPLRRGFNTKVELSNHNSKCSKRTYLKY